MILILKTFVLTDIAWVFFRAKTISSAVFIIRKSFELDNIGLLLNDGLYQLGLGTKDMNILLIALAVLFVSSYLREKGEKVSEVLLAQNAIFRYVLYWGAVIMIILSLDITGQEFIYFQF